MPIDAASHFSGKRATERQRVDLRVELRGGGIVLQGHAVDMTQHGIGILLTESALEGYCEPSDPMGAMEILDRYFSSGVDVCFPSVEASAEPPVVARFPAQVVRLSVPPRSPSQLSVGCKFTRPLTPTEWATVVGGPPPETPNALADLKPGPPVQLVVYDPARGPKDGPIHVLHVVRGSLKSIEAIVQSTQPQWPSDVHASLNRGALPARMASPDGIAWDGTVRLAETRPGSRGDVVVRLDAVSPWSPQFLKRLQGP